MWSTAPANPENVLCVTEYSNEPLKKETSQLLWQSQKDFCRKWPREVFARMFVCRTPAGLYLRLVILASWESGSLKLVINPPSPPQKSIILKLILIIDLQWRWRWLSVKDIEPPLVFPRSCSTNGIFFPLSFYTVIVNVLYTISHVINLQLFRFTKWFDFQLQTNVMPSKKRRLPNGSTNTSEK